MSNEARHNAGLTNVNIWDTRSSPRLPFGELESVLSRVRPLAKSVGTALPFRTAVFNVSA